MAGLISNRETVIRLDGLTKAHGCSFRGVPVCRITDVYEAAIEFPGLTRNVADARRFAREVLDGAGNHDDGWVVAQVVSELATNAIVHAGTGFILTVAYDESSIRVSVTDRNPLARAVLRRFSAETTTGRGLRLVDTLGRSWGVDQTKSVKTVWCDLQRGAMVGVDADTMTDEALNLFFPEVVETPAIDELPNAYADAVGYIRHRCVA
jgi:anti-sigma regulatory factor (Ser/Thr protein kinase)